MAGRYICPVCDRRLRMKHFCTYCKSFVKEPVYYTGPVANESYDSAGRPGCMADQHYGLGHVHSPMDRQREYGHHKAGTGARQNPPVRQGASANRPVRRQSAGSTDYRARLNTAQSARSGQRSGYGVSPVRSGQNSGRPQAEGSSRTAKKLVAVVWAIIVVAVLGQVVFSLVGSQVTGMAGNSFYFVPFTFLFQVFNIILQAGIWALIVWVIVRNIRRK